MPVIKIAKSDVVVKLLLSLQNSQTIKICSILSVSILNTHTLYVYISEAGIQHLLYTIHNIYIILQILSKQGFTDQVFYNKLSQFNVKRYIETKIKLLSPQLPWLITQFSELSIQ